MTRLAVTEKIVATKIAKNLTWKGLAEAVGRSEVWTTSALLGQQSMSADEAANAGRLLDLTPEEVRLLQVPPTKGSLASIPSTVGAGDVEHDSVAVGDHSAGMDAGRVSRQLLQR
jgi:cyanate lyase